MTMRLKTAALAFAALLFLCMNGAVTVRAAAPGISSLSAAVYCVEADAFLYEKDSRTPRPMASTTKLMTALVAAECLDPDATVEVPTGAVPVEGTQLGLRAGQPITVRDLLSGLLLESGNDAANALALTVADSFDAFSARMNERAASIGMTDSRFVTPSGLDAEGHAASARDMALLGAVALGHPLVAELCASKSATLTLDGTRVTVTNHNKLLRLMEDCIGLKTGFTKKSGRCLVSAVRRDGVTVVVATLNGGDYWNDHKALYDYAFSLVERRDLTAQVPSTLPVAGGADTYVTLAWTPPTAVVRREDELRATVELPAFAWAPVAAGDAVGRVRFAVGDRTVATAPITATQEVAVCAMPSSMALWWRRFTQLLYGLVR